MPGIGKVAKTGKPGTATLMPAMPEGSLRTDAFDRLDSAAKAEGQRLVNEYRQNHRNSLRSVDDRTLSNQHSKLQDDITYSDRMADRLTNELANTNLNVRDRAKTRRLRDSFEADSAAYSAELANIQDEAKSRGITL